MSGTSGDGIDVALVHTDGRSLTRTDAAMVVPYRPQTQQAVHQALHNYALASPGSDARVALDVLIAEDYALAVKGLCTAFSVSPDTITLAGFHGQTLFHDPEAGFTDQAGDASRFVNLTGIDTVFDVRGADMKAGGQGAPLAPVYHQALIASVDVPMPAAFLNIGGVSNITWTDTDQLMGFDCGPGNALMDDYLNQQTGLPYDDQGRMAATGTPNETVVSSLLQDPFFSASPPKSLDRQHFKHAVGSCLQQSAPMDLNDTMATLCEFTARSVQLAIKLRSAPPATLIVAGGGQHNTHLVSRMEALLNTTDIVPANEIGLPGDVIEAELMAYLAARHVAGLPTSWPSTTGCAHPVSGGELITASSQR